MIAASLLIFSVYLLWLLYEKRCIDHARSSFLHVIHVNGIRGKTSVCRMLDACLRSQGYRVFTKTTGTTPVYIDTAGAEHPIRRSGPANIREQIHMMRRASREKAEILILECMAVSPELQKFSQEKIVHGDWNVITNVRYDHIFEMGETLDEIAESLSSVIPENGLLFTADSNFYPFFQKKAASAHSEVILCAAQGQAEGVDSEDFILPTVRENEAIVSAIAARLGGGAAVPYECREDFGACRMYPFENGSFLNLFSVNDPQSTLTLLRHFFPETEEIIFLYNHRPDRPDRLLLFIRWFFPCVSWKKIIVMGEGAAFAVRKLKASGFQHVERVKDWREALHTSCSGNMVGIGNIKGQAYDMISFLEGGKPA
ncbi:MAG: poly-gamma-glutamate synthase PgsB [Lachnospiraceae bacterium]|nr:poly-gamma-glutamate synthase PgsB [Lachnospiraceae bacterium]